MAYGYDQHHGTDPEGDGGTDRGRGQLTSVSNSDYSKAFYYNDLGLLRSDVITISGSISYTTRYSYDSYRRPSQTIYPGGETTTLYYNSMGLPAKLNSSTFGDLIDGSTDVGAVTNAVTYDMAGRLTASRTTVNNRHISYSYFPWLGSSNNTNGRLDTIKVGRTTGAADLLALGYSYDSFGNISSLTEQYNADTSATNSFGYDQQNRLTEAYNPVVTGPDYSYDSIGRLTGYEGLGYTYDSAHIHAVDLVNGVDRYDYDANGNMTVRNKGLSSEQTLTWDHENRLETITGGGLPTESYLYDADGARIKKTSNGVSTYYISPLFEVTGSVETRYYYFNGQRVAMHNSSPATNGVVTYLHSDHLGSTVLTTDTSTNPSGDQRYYAYGQQRDLGPVATDHQFTGQKLDGTGLQYYNARYYDPTLGTFISPDTIVPDPGTLIDYNRYAYSRANPLKFSDPSGHDPLDTAWQEEFFKNHGRAPGQDDIRGRLFSLVLPGSGANGAWTSEDWNLFAGNFEAFFNGGQEWPLADTKLSPGLERFATRVDKLSSYYAGGEEDNFVRATGTLFGGLDYRDPLLVSLIELIDAIAGTTNLPHLADGTDGWAQRFLEPHDDPGHHFIGLFYAGYFHGPYTGHVGNIARDWGNLPDLSLGIVGVNQGVRFRQGEFGIHDLGNVIRREGSNAGFPWATFLATGR